MAHRAHFTFGSGPVLGPASSWLRGLVGVATLGVGLACLAGCSPEIGDKCQLATDCSIRADRVCDTSQPNGYCTQSCQGNACPDDAACVLFGASLPGCGLDDRSGPGAARTSRSFCSARCETDADCRAAEGYVCADPRSPPWNALILDGDQSKRTCLVLPIDGLDGGAPASTVRAPVCGPSGPDVPPIVVGDAGSSSDAGADAGDAGSGDAGDAGDAGADGG